MLENTSRSNIGNINLDSLDKILGLGEKGLRSTLLLPLGYRDTDKDWLVNLKKVRKPMTELVTYIS